MLPERGRTRVGAVDGSSFGPLNASGFAFLETLELLADLEPWEKQGKELPASSWLLQRVVEREGKGFIELLATDGLYATRDFFRFCQEELGCHAVVKTDEESLTVRQDADGLFEAYPRLREVAHARWLEENNGFKALNEQCHAKHAFVREPGALARLVLLLFLAFTSLQAYRLAIEAVKEHLGLAAAWEPLAFRFLRQLL